MSEDIFAGTTGEQTGNEGSTSNKENESLFSVGEREYTIESAKTKIEHADEHIKTLEKENADLRNTSGKIDEVLDALKPSNDTNKDQQTKPGLSQDDVLSLIEQNDAAKVAKDNRIEVGRLMTERFGDKVQDKITEIGNQLNLGAKTLQSLAEKSPKAFMALFPESNAGQNESSSSTGTINSEAVNMATPDEGTYAYYEKIRKDNPKLYNKAATQKRMLQDAERLGPDAFFGRK